MLVLFLLGVLTGGTDILAMTGAAGTETFRSDYADDGLLERPRIEPTEHGSTHDPESGRE